MEELDLKELFNIFWHKKQYILVIIAIFMVVGLIYTSILLTPKYKASTTLLLASNQSTEGSSNTISTTQAEVNLNQKLVSTYSELIKSNKILRSVIENLGIQMTESQLKSKITVTAVKDTEIIQISVIDGNAQTATNIANEIADVFGDEVKNIYNINNVYVVDKAEVPTSPYNINHIKDIIIFAFIGAIVAFVYVLIANMLDTTIKTTEDIEKEIGLPVLASIPMYEVELRKGGRK